MRVRTVGAAFARVVEELRGDVGYHTSRLGAVAQQ